MYERIYFNTAQLLDKALFERFLHENLMSIEFIWITNFNEFILDNEIDKQTTYISLETSTAGFKFHYSVFENNILELTLRERIEILKNLAKKFNVEILSTDDEVNPWTWVLIEPNGETSTIETKDADVLVVDDFYNFPIGDFRTKTKLSDSEIDVLKEIITTSFPNIDIVYGTDGPVINGNFNKVKSNFHELSLFDNHYTIVPVGKNIWLDKNEKSELFVDFMLDIGKQINKDLCVFPSNYSEVKKIEGGSDSEEHCLIVTKETIEKIVYKRRRKSWNNKAHHSILAKVGLWWQKLFRI
ncbi:MAG: hypothetical protein N4A41_13895 [Crocinitomicaceae bacterium]|jgi:hypothetical protein|nr:hypothetical protein [Crocinitomicaceae bacterium]